MLAARAVAVAWRDVARPMEENGGASFRAAHAGPRADMICDLPCSVPDGATPAVEIVVLTAPSGGCRQMGRVVAVVGERQRCKRRRGEASGNVGELEGAAFREQSSDRVVKRDWVGLECCI